MTADSQSPQQPPEAKQTSAREAFDESRTLPESALSALSYINSKDEHIARLEQGIAEAARLLNAIPSDVDPRWLTEAHSWLAAYEPMP